jgi:hypothetical protein
MSKSSPPINTMSRLRRLMRQGRLGETCRPPQTPRHSFRTRLWWRRSQDGGFGGNGTFPPAFLLGFGF